MKALFNQIGETQNSPLSMSKLADAFEERNDNITKVIANLSEKEVKSIFHYLYINGRGKALKNFLLQVFMSKEKLSLSLVLVLLVKSKKKIPFSLELSSKDSMELYFIRNELQEPLLSTCSSKLSKLEKKQEELKEKLLEQYEFFKSQRLEEKTAEIIEKISLSFPNEKIVSDFNTKNSEKNYAKVIEQSAKNFSNEAQSYRAPEELELISNWAKMWESVFEQSGEIGLLLCQLRFLDVDNEADALNQIDLNKYDFWDQLEVLFICERYFQGLAILDQNDTEAFTNAPEKMYTYYYYKALFLKGAGMDDQALEVLEALMEQNKSYRDVQILYESWK